MKLYGLKGSRGWIFSEGNVTNMLANHVIEISPNDIKERSQENLVRELRREIYKLRGQLLRFEREQEQEKPKDPWED